MVRLNFLHTCDQAMLSNDGKVSIIGLFQNINTRSLPAAHPMFSVVTNIVGEPGKYKQTIAIVPPSNDSPIASVSGESTIKKSGGGNIFVANFINTLFKEGGRYFIEVSIEKDGRSGIISNKNDHFFLVREVNE